MPRKFWFSRMDLAKVMDAWERDQTAPWKNGKLQQLSMEKQGVFCVERGSSAVPPTLKTSCTNPRNSRGSVGTLVLRKWVWKSTSSWKSNSKTFLGILRRESFSRPGAAEGEGGKREGGKKGRKDSRKERMEKEKDGRKGKGWKGEGRDRAVTAWGQDKHTWLIPNWIIPSKDPKDFSPF